MNSRSKFLSFALALFVGALAASLTACGQRGEAEKAGEKIDEAVEETKEGAEDLFDKDGPAEETGEKVDDALDR